MKEPITDAQVSRIISFACGVDAPTWGPGAANLIESLQAKVAEREREIASRDAEIARVYVYWGGATREREQLRGKLAEKDREIFAATVSKDAAWQMHQHVEGLLAAAEAKIARVRALTVYTMAGVFKIEADVVKKSEIDAALDDTETQP
jgi:hypothetical protein